MKVEIPYGKGKILFSHENIERVVFSRIREIKNDRNPDDIVRRAMKEPIESPSLRRLAQGKEKAVILLSDHTRPVPSRHIIPHMLKELREGNPKIDITLLVATGCHRQTSRQELAEKLGREIAEQEKILVHDCDESPLIDLGELPSGARLIINKAAADCDLLLAEGFIEPHFFAGFSGGRKSVLPGICGRKTVLGNHCSRFIADPAARTGILDGNPIHQDMAAAAKMAGLAYIVNVIINEKQEVIAAFAGDPVSAHRQGCDFLKEYCGVKTGEKNRIVITSNGGFPLDQNAYQAVKSMTAGEAFCQEGGVIIVCAQCADGIGGEFFYRKMAECPDLESLTAEIMAAPMEETVPDQWQYQILTRILQKFHVILVCDPSIKKQIIDMKLHYAATLEEAVEQALAREGADCPITVIPDGVSIIGEK